MYVDHSYVRLADGSMYCVAGNQHTRTEILGCLYYVPPGDPLLKEIPIGHQETSAPAQAGPPRPVKVGHIVKKSPSRFRRSLEDKGIRCWETTHLQALRINRIEEHFEPRAALRRLLEKPHRHGCRQDVLHRFVELATSNGVPLECLGVSGSACFDGARTCDVRDLDLVLHPPLRMGQLCRATTAIFAPLGRLDADDHRRRAYVRARVPGASDGERAGRELVDRRVDVGWIGDTQIDLTEVRDGVDRVPQWIFDAEFRGVRSGEGIVSELDRGYPFTLRMDGCAKTVQVTRRGWQGVLSVGDRVRVRGACHTDGRSTVIVVDEMTDHEIRLLEPGRRVT